jgi:integrase
MTAKLSERTIARLIKSAAGRETMATDGEVPSLFVRVHPSGLASYNFRRREHGRTYKGTIGQVGSITLADARRTARAWNGRIALGFDPIAEKAEKAERNRAEQEARRRARIEAKTAGTFTVAKMIDALAAPRKDDERSVRYVRAIKTTLETTFESVLELPARNLKGERIEGLIEAARTSRGEAAASKAQIAIKMACSLAVRRGELEVNPCATLEPPPKARDRERKLSAGEMQRVWRGAGLLPVPDGAFIRFLTLTGVRRNEAHGCRWSEIEGDLWHIPAGRMKAKREFTVPLSAAALRALPERGAGDLIFAKNDGGALGSLSRLKTALDAAIEADGDGPLPFRFHDLRRTLVTWLSDRGVDYIVADLCLAHALPLSQAGRVYQRSFKIAERRQALELWGRFLDPDSAETAPALRVVA